MASNEDATLWAAFRRGSRQAYATIYQRQVRALFAYGCKFTSDHSLVEDCIHDLFFYLWEQRRGLGNTQSIRYYLFKSLRRRIVKQVQQTQSSLDFDEPAGYLPTALSPEAHWIEQQGVIEQEQQLARAFGVLSERHREAIYLKYYHSLSAEEIASVMHVNRRTVYKLLDKALKMMKREFSPLVIATSVLFFLYGYLSH